MSSTLARAAVLLTGDESYDRGSPPGCGDPAWPPRLPSRPPPILALLVKAAERFVEGSYAWLTSACRPSCTARLAWRHEIFSASAT